MQPCMRTPWKVKVKSKSYRETKWRFLVEYTQTHASALWYISSQSLYYHDLHDLRLCSHDQHDQHQSRSSCGQLRFQLKSTLLEHLLLLAFSFILIGEELVSCHVTGARLLGTVQFSRLASECFWWLTTQVRRSRHAYNHLCTWLHTLRIISSNIWMWYLLLTWCDPDQSNRMKVMIRWYLWWEFWWSKGLYEWWSELWSGWWLEW